MAPHHLSSLLAVLGGVANGSYMVFVKRPEVMRAGVHPIVFQALKSAAAALYGLALLALRTGGRFEFHWLGLLSACMWVPAGLCNIACVPLAGVGACAVASSCVASVASFCVGIWLGETVKPHEVYGHVIYYAPLYILGVCAGMVALVLAPRWVGAGSPFAAYVSPSDQGRNDALRPLRRPAPPRAAAAGSRGFFGVYSPARRMLSCDDAIERALYDNSPILSPRHHEPTDLEPDLMKPAFSGVVHSLIATAADRRSLLLGYLLACIAGCFAAGMYTVVAIAKRGATSAESVDPLGSWGVSFGLGAALGTIVAAALVACTYAAAGWPLPPMRWGVAWVPGASAGIVWTVGNVFTTLAVAGGGSAVVMAQNQATNLVTAGLWGLVLYREHKGRAALAWAAAALFTVAMVVLLSFEKVAV